MSGESRHQCTVCKWFHGPRTADHSALGVAADPPAFVEPAGIMAERDLVHTNEIAVTGKTLLATMKNERSACKDVPNTLFSVHSQKVQTR